MCPMGPGFGADGMGKTKNLLKKTYLPLTDNFWWLIKRGWLAEFPFDRLYEWSYALQLQTAAGKVFIKYNIANRIHNL